MSKKINFLVVGGARCGTTSFHDFLASQNGICMPRIKETHFWCGDNIRSHVSGPGDEYLLDLHYPRTIEDYFRKFDCNSDEGEKKLLGDCCPSYLFYSEVVSEKYYEHNPKGYIIVIWRDPIERLISNFQLLVEAGRENADINRAIAEESGRRLNGWEWTWSYIENSMYWKLSQPFIRYFGRKVIFLPFNEIFLDRNNNQSKRLLSKVFGIDVGIMPWLNVTGANGSMGMLRGFHRRLSVNSEFYRGVSRRIKMRYADIFNRISTSGRARNQREKLELELCLPESLKEDLQNQVALLREFMRINHNFI